MTQIEAVDNYSSFKKESMRTPYVHTHTFTSTALLKIKIVLIEFSEFEFFLCSGTPVCRVSAPASAHRKRKRRNGVPIVYR